jgi:hypothetical protein
MNKSNTKILIVGGGKVGLDALNYCKENNFTAIILDNDPKCLVHSEVDEIHSNSFIKGVNEIKNGSILFLMELNELPDILRNINFDYIIPAVPIHLMAKVAQIFLEKNNRVIFSGQNLHVIKERLNKSIILNSDQKKGILIASFMPKGQICSSNCEEYLICPITGIEKEKPLYEIFRDITRDFNAIILRSRQLKPNLGGFSGKDIKRFFKFLEIVDNEFIIGTACMCHGVINIFKI